MTTKWCVTRTILLWLISLAVFTPIGAEANILRDEEAETYLRNWSKPILEAAGLNPTNVRIIIIHDDNLNAFVSGGQNIFLHSGLLRQAESVDQIVGVIAHEAAHIAGGHLARFDDARKESLYQTILTMLIGAGAAIASGEAGTALLLGAPNIGQRRLLSSLRRFESSADHAALRYLNKLQFSAKGYYSFLRILQKRSKIYKGRVDPYVQTHPLTKNRLAHVRNYLADTGDIPNQIPARWNDQFKRLQAKFNGFLLEPHQVVSRYLDDNTIPSLYALTIANYRSNNLKSALARAKQLITLEPNNPYFHELLGQILFENGQAKAAIIPLRQAHNLRPNSAPLLTLLARAELGVQGLKNITAATSHLIQALRLEPDNTIAWHFIALAHGHQGQIGHAALALAEKSLLLGAVSEAQAQARRAIKHLASDSPERRRADDILNLLSPAS